MKASVLMAAVLGGLVSTAAWAAPSYSVLDFGANSGVSDINNLGQVVGALGSPQTSGGQWIGFEWSAAGGMQTFPGQPGYVPSALNDVGQVLFVHNYTDPNDPMQNLYATQVRNADGSTTPLPAPPSYYNAGFIGSSINNAGQVSGLGLRQFSNEDTSQSEGFFWTPGQGLTALPPQSTDPWEQTTAMKINDAGQVLWMRSRRDDNTSFLDYQIPVLHTADGQDLQLPFPVPSQGGFPDARGLNNQGVVAGWLYGTGSFLWTQAAGLRYIGGDNTRAVGINDQGTVLGTVDGQAALWTEAGGWQPLAKMMSPSDAKLLASVGYWQLQDINNLGQIIIDANIDGTQHALLLTPVPEPATLTLMLGGVGFVGWRARRKQHAKA
jgi:hypothetical protein